MKLLTALLLTIGLLSCGDDSTTPPPMEDGGETDDAEVDAGMMMNCEDGEIPSARGELNAVFDETKNRLVVFGGNVVAPQMCMPAYEYTEEMWAFDLECETWSRIEATGPTRRGRQAMALDTMRNRMVLVGGRERVSGGYTNYNDVWAFDLANDTWEEISTSGSPPSPRHNSAAIYDVDRDRIVVFGGNPSEDGLMTFGTDDTFALDLATNEWSEIATADPKPNARYYHGAVEMNGKLYVFGGNEDFFTSLNDTWELDLSTDTWTRLAGGGPSAPTTRFGATLFADDDANRFLMVAGHDSTSIGNVNDIWSFDVASAAWAQLYVGDTINNPIMNACDPPADFANMELDAPERRHGNAVAQSSTRGFMIFGKTDCGNVNDVWAVDFANPAWALVGANSTSGEACARSGNTMCTRLCF